MHGVHLLPDLIPVEFFAESVAQVVGRDPAAAVDVGGHGPIAQRVEAVLIRDIAVG